MRAVQFKCPNCGATLQVADTALQLTCSYCGQVSRIAQRSRVLQRVQLPAGPSNLPVVTSPVKTGRWVAFGAIFAMTTAFVPAFFAMRRGTMPDVTPAAEQRPWSPSWNGRPVVSDVDADGTDDLIGMTRYYHNGDQAKLAAFSGATGALMWESPGLGKYADAEGTLAAAGDKILRATSDGRVHAYERATGARAWALDLGEKTIAFCAADAGAVFALAADRRVHRLELATGKRTDAPALRAEDEWDSPHARSARDRRAPCDRILDNRQHSTQGATRLRFDQIDVAGFSMSVALLTPSGARYVLGRRTPGTGVPMIAALDEKRRTRWTAVIPQDDILNATSTDDHVAITDELIIVTYLGRDRVVRLAAFELADGARRWDVPTKLDWNLSGMVATRRAVALIGWSRLHAFDLKTGAALFEIR